MTTAISRLRKLAEAATQFTAEHDPRTIDIEGGGQAAILRVHEYQDPESCQDIDAEQAGADADLALIAAMRNALPALLDLIEEADNLANMTDSHTRRHYDTARSALETEMGK